MIQVALVLENNELRSECRRALRDSSSFLLKDLFDESAELDPRDSKGQSRSDSGKTAWTRADVVLVDQLTPQVSTYPSREIARGETGVVAIGVNAGGDVLLPVDFAARELRLAVRLLSEIVKLRRRQRLDTRKQRVLRLLAMSDALTGLPNRRAWDDELTRRLQATAAANGEFALAVFDIDRFKACNDERGFSFGDRVLQTVARELAAEIHNHGFIARLGGDEFAFLASEDAATSVPETVDHIRRVVAERAAGQLALDLALSAGVVVVAPGAVREMTTQSALDAVDLALRTAKRKGRDRTYTGRL